MKKSQIDAILLGFSKAFDKVHHLGLIQKMKSYDISDNIIKWTESFLLGTNQKVIAEGIESDTKSVKLGVPQGTVLGPLPFLIYINDIDLNLYADTTIRLFADDSLLYREIKSTEDCKALHKDVDTLQEWESK